jgi:hypothetical protein
MTDLIDVLLVALVALVGYHIATYGRRGRRWGLTNRNR